MGVSQIKYMGRLAAVGLAVATLRLAMASSGAAQTTPTAKPKITGPDIMLMQPTAAKTGDNEFEVMVKAAGGQPINDADVSVVLVMPKTATMAEMRNEVKLKSSGNGMYMGSGNVMMAGTWNATVSVQQGGKEIGQKKVIVTAK